MYAVFELSGFQFRAEEGAVLQVPRQAVPEGESFEIPNVLLLRNDDTSLIGTPNVEGASIKAEVVGSTQGDKVTVFKKKRRTKYRLTKGHRQDYSQIKITKIVTP